MNATETPPVTEPTLDASPTKDPAIAAVCDETVKELMAVKPPKPAPLQPGERIGPLPRLAVLAVSASSDASRPEIEEAASLRKRAEQLEVIAARRGSSIAAEVAKSFGRALPEKGYVQIVTEKGEAYLEAVASPG